MVACDNQKRVVSEKKRKIFTDTQKAKVALEAMKGVNHHAKLTRESEESTLKNCQPGIV